VDALKELKTINAPVPKAQTEGLLQVVFAPDNKTLYSCGFDKDLRAWDVTDGREVKDFGLTPDDVYGMVLSKDGKTLATAGYGGHLRLWDIETGKAKAFQLAAPKKKTMITYCIAFTPDGQAVVTGHEWDNCAIVTPLSKFADIKVEKKEPKKKEEKTEPKKDDKDNKKDTKKEKDKQARAVPPGASSVASEPEWLALLPESQEGVALRFRRRACPFAVT
jgi:WD40 repeat protein